jgi:hypothetical protein
MPGVSGPPANKLKMPIDPAAIPCQHISSRMVHSVRNVRAKTLARHPLLGLWGTKSAPNIPWSFGHLMFIEGRVVISSMLRLAREHNILALPVHDSLIVPRSKEAIAERILDEQFTAIVGVKPTLKIRPLSARYF